jgi:hypothetical protein
MSNEKETKKLTVILDPIGRTVLGETVCCGGECSNEVVKLKNPVILHIVPADNQGKMSVQLLPLFFREFLADKAKVIGKDLDDAAKNAASNWNFIPAKRNNEFVTASVIVPIDFKLE